MSRGEQRCSRAPGDNLGHKPPRHVGHNPPGWGADRSVLVPGGERPGARQALPSHLKPQSNPRGCCHLGQTKWGHFKPPPGLSPRRWGWAKGSPSGPGASAEGLHCFFSAFINHGSLWPLPRARHNSGWVINRILGSFRLIKAEGGGAAGRRHDYITLSLPCQNKEYRRCRPLFLQHISARLLTPHFRPNQGLKTPATTPPPVSQRGRAVGCPAPQLVAQLPLDFAGERSTVHPPARRRDGDAGAAGAQPDLRPQAGEGAEAPGVDAVAAGGCCSSGGGDETELPPCRQPQLEPHRCRSGQGCKV